MTDCDEPDNHTNVPAAEDNSNNNNTRTPSAAACCGSGSADEAANNDQSESLGEIWFDTMRRNHGGSNHNSTPSSPTNSTAEPEGSESSAASNPPYKKRKFVKAQQKQKSYNMSSLSGSVHESSTKGGDANRHNHSNEKRGGYQSDDEGFNMANSSDSSGYFRRGDCQPQQSAQQEPVIQDDKDKAEPVSSSTNKTTAGDNSTSQDNSDSNSNSHKPSNKTAEPSPPKNNKNTSTKKATPERLLEETASKNKKRQGVAHQDQDDMNNSKKKKAKSLSSGSGGDTCGDTDTLQQRLERNAREKERSSKITDQFQILKDMLAQVGVVVPKGTKGSILSLAHQYICSMKRQEAQQAADNRALQQEIETISQGRLGPTAASALRIAAQRNALAVHPGISVPVLPPAAPAASFDPLTVVKPKDYPVLWDHSPSGIALATLGGTFLDCNQVFQRMLHFSKAQLREISIFHLIDSHNDKGILQFAFDQITNMLQSIDPNNSDAVPGGSRPVVLRGSVQGHGHLGLAISLLHASNSMQQQQPHENGTQRHQYYLCVTLIDKSLMTATAVDDGNSAILRPAHPALLPASSLAQPAMATAIPMVGSNNSSTNNNNMSIMEPAAISAAAATLTALPTMFMNHPYSQAASTSLPSASSGLLPIPGTNVMLMATPTTGATMASAINMIHHDGGISMQESASKEQQQQNFGGADPFYTGTVG
jgi:PAS domain-containing protein